MFSEAKHEVADSFKGGVKNAVGDLPGEDDAASAVGGVRFEVEVMCDPFNGSVISRAELEVAESLKGCIVIMAV